MSLFKSSNPPKKVFTQPNQSTLRAAEFQSVISNLAWMFKDIDQEPPAGMVALSNSILEGFNTKPANGIDTELAETMNDMRKVLLDVKKHVKEGELHWPNNENHGTRTFDSEVLNAIKLLDKMRADRPKNTLK